MGKFWRKYRWLISALLVLLFAISGKTLVIHRIKPDAKAREIKHVFAEKQKALQKMMSDAAVFIENPESRNNIWEQSDGEKFDKDGLAISIYKNDSLLYWTSSFVTFPFRNGHRSDREGAYKLPTGWFYKMSQKAGAYRVDGYILIKRTFPYRNKYIRSNFQKDFNLPDNYDVDDEISPKATNIIGNDNRYAFSIVGSDDSGFSERNAAVLAILYLLFAIFLLTHINELLIRTRKIKPWQKTTIVSFAAFMFYFIVNQLKIPDAIFSLEIFSPVVFAYGSWLTSLGEYAFLSLLMLHIAQSFYRFHEIPQPNNKRFNLVRLTPYLFFGLYFTFSVFLLLALLNNSNISLEMFTDLRISAINILAFFSVSLQVLGIGIILIRIKCLNSKERKLDFIVATVVSAFLFITLFKFIDLNVSYFSLLFLLVVSCLFKIIDTSKIIRYRLTVLLIFAVLSAAYLNLLTHDQIDEKKNKEQKLWAVNLASERDPAAEIFLSEFENNIKSDTLIQRHLFPPYHSLENYLRNNYFTGFWRNYELVVTVCAPTDSLLIQEEDAWHPCLDFFNTLKATMGVLVPGSNFYFMNQLNGRISYMGQLDISTLHNHRTLAVFVELYSKIIPEGKGYPQLLLDEQASRKSRENGFSYAKYFGGRLVDRGGEYPYNLKPPQDVNSGQEFTYLKQAGFNHCIYHRGGDNYVMVSYQENTLLNQLGTFPYLFLLIYVLGFTWIILNRKTTGFGRKKLDFREKIQTTLVLTLLGILFIIGMGLILYNYNEFRVTLKQNLEEKIRAISAEIELRIGNSNQLTSIRDVMNDQLIEISDVTWTDINLYDTNGRLASTSRREIFDQGLTSRTMDPQAFRALSFEGKAMFLHNENLGDMKFFSAYTPVFNMFDQLVGYVNLPYFSRQDDFTKEVSGFIVAFSNIYIFLILISLLIALIISNKLTAPLLRIEENLKGIELGKENAKIDYLGEDEIGRLAKEYNKKVDELAESAALLARSERELAWKEMARQIAHEINNPLTPMKLNIQYLQKIKEQGAENFNEYFNHVTKSLIEQIEVLSSIASAFSDFAKMSGFKSEPINLAEQINEVAFLFENSVESKIEINIPKGQQIMALGDKSQFNRALINLIKNGIQAIPSNEKGLISINLEKVGDTAKITVSDNGTGIPSNIHDRLFEPNFTTKNSGMGLGLAITKRIVENMKGEIRFQTSPGNGTSFIVEIPIRY